MCRVVGRVALETFIVFTPTKQTHEFIIRDNVTRPEVDWSCINLFVSLYQSIVFLLGTIVSFVLSVSMDHDDTTTITRNQYDSFWGSGFDLDLREIILESRNVGHTGRKSTTGIVCMYSHR